MESLHLVQTQPPAWRHSETSCGYIVGGERWDNGCVRLRLLCFDLAERSRRGMLVGCVTDNTNCKASRCGETASKHR